MVIIKIKRDNNDNPTCFKNMGCEDIVYSFRLKILCG